MSREFERETCEEEIARLYQEDVARLRADVARLTRERDEDAIEAQQQIGVVVSERFALEGAIKEIKRLRAEVERLRMQLSACGVLAMSNTPHTLALNRAIHPDYDCASVQDVIRGVEREIALMADAERLTSERDEARREYWAVRESMDSLHRVAREDCNQSAARAEKAEARVAEMEAAAKNVMRFSPHVTCGEVHHGPGDHHGSMERCPPVLRYMESKSVLRELLSPKPAPFPDLTFDADDPAPCATCGGKTVIPSWAGPDWPIDCPDCRAEEAK